jgi:hypothetical protein
MKKEVAELKVRLLSILNEWEVGEIDEYQLHHTAEDLFNRYDWKVFDKSEPESVIMEALSHVEIMNHQLVIKQDIPIIINFIEGCETPGDSWCKWSNYWDNIDYDARKLVLKSNVFYMIG